MDAMNKKYEFTGKEKNGLRRIRALRDVRPGVKAGDLGGWIEKEDNLSHDDTCWVFGDAKVFDNALVSDNAEVFGKAKVFDNALVYGNAKVSDNAVVYGEALVCGKAKVFGDAKVFGKATVCGDAWVSGNALVFDNAEVYGKAVVYDNALVYGNALVCGNAEVYDNAKVHGEATSVRCDQYNRTIVDQNATVTPKEVMDAVELLARASIYYGTDAYIHGNCITFLEVKYSGESLGEVLCMAAKALRKKATEQIESCESEIQDLQKIIA
jgi:carbonic anhydrase/acetyltransferase-like protein (isoleucine patch superfamily)